MKHEDTVKQSFKIQAKKFAAYHMSKAEYTDYLIQKIGAGGKEHALEVAAGTCICGRALAPFVEDITCLDLTEEMLEQGKRLAEESGLKNIYFRTGNAEKLPYEEETFDLVITRLSFHHFTNPVIPFREMQRVLKKGGKLVVWDMEATEEPLRKIDDKIEKLKSWMELTDTPEELQNEIVVLMKNDLAGGEKTGFSPYMKGTEIMFDHRWLLLIGIKK